MATSSGSPAGRFRRLFLLLAVLGPSCGGAGGDGGIDLKIPANFSAEVGSSYQLQKTSLYINRQGIRTANPGTFVHAIAYADFDQDGDIDVFMASGDTTANPTPFELYLNDGSNKFTLDTTFFAGSPPGMVHPRKALVGDYNGDGKPDIFIIGHGYDQPPYPGEAPMVLLSSPAGFVQGTGLSTYIGFNHGGASADIDGDGDIDVFIANNSTPFFLINDGTGHFTRDTSRLSGDLRGKSFFTAELVDMDNDGYIDLLVGGHEQDGMKTYILWGDSTGFYSTAKSTLIPPVVGYGTVLDIDAEDLDGDGKRDLVINRTGGGPGGPGFYSGSYVQVVFTTGVRQLTDVTATKITGGTTPNWYDWIRLQPVDAGTSIDILVDDAARNLKWFNNGAGVFGP